MAEWGLAPLIVRIRSVKQAVHPLVDRAMISTTIPGKARATMPDDELLRRIASALGVSADAFFVLPEQHVFHVAADGTRWLLSNAEAGLPQVQCIPSQIDNPNVAGEGMIDFLVRNSDSSQGRALASLINSVLSMHLHLDMRS